jgi:hypothetical protein
VRVVKLSKLSVLVILFAVAAGLPSVADADPTVPVAPLTAASSCHDGSCHSHLESDTIDVAAADRLAEANRVETDRLATQFNVAKAKLGGNRGSVGEWSAPKSWDVIGIHMSLLPNGKVLAFDQISDLASEAGALPHNFVRAQVWDPTSDTYERVDNTTGFNLFCAGFAKLPNGELYMTGGNADAANNGIKTSTIFDEATRTWRLATDSDYPRWYPSVTPMANGDMLIVGGTTEDPDNGFTTSLPEVRSLDDRMRKLPGVYDAFLTDAAAPWENRLYPWMMQAPNGKAAFLGPSSQVGFIDTAGNGTFQRFTVPRDATPTNPGGQFRFYGGVCSVRRRKRQGACHRRGPVEQDNLPY